jgi:hypothetical protein
MSGPGQRCRSLAKLRCPGRAELPAGLSSRVRGMAGQPPDWCLLSWRLAVFAVVPGLLVFAVPVSVPPLLALPAGWLVPAGGCLLAGRVG